MLALRALGNLALRLGEGELAVLPNVDEHDITRNPAALEQTLRKRVLDERLDCATQRTGAIDGIGALLGEQILCSVRELDGHAIANETVAQVRDHEVDDAANLGVRERLEDHDLINTVQELRAEELLELAHRTALDLRVGEGARVRAKAHGARLGNLARTGVARHDDDGVGEIDLATLTISQAAFVEDLQQDVEDIRVSLLNLVEEDDGVGPATDGLSELATLVIAHVSRRRAHELAHSELLHVLAHVEGDERILGTKEELRERLGELGLAHARGTQEDERTTRTTRVLERRAAAADGARHGAHGLLLADDALVENAFAAQQLRRLGLGEVRDGHTRDRGDDICDGGLIDGHDVGVHALVPCILELDATSEKFLLAVAQAGGVLELLPVSGSFLVSTDTSKVLVHLGDLWRKRHVVDTRAGTRLVEDINRLVRQEAVLDVAVRERDGGNHRFGRVAHVVVRLVGRLEALNDLDRVLWARLVDVHRLEATLERGVLLDVLAVLLCRGGADDLDLAAGQRGLQDARGVDGSLRGARADDGVHLVDEEDDLAVLLHLGDDLLEAILELAAVLGARDEGGDVERPDLLAAKHVGHGAGRDELRQALDDSGLANARVTQDERVVLLTSREHLHHALDLAIAANDRVKLALSGERREVAPVLLEHRGVIARGRAGARRADGHAIRANADLLRLRGCAIYRRVLLNELVNGIADGIARNAKAAQRLHRHAVAFANDAKQQVFGRDVGGAAAHGLAIGALEHALGARRERDVTARHGLIRAIRDLAHGLERLVIRNVKLGKGLGGDALPLLDEGKKQVLRANVHLPQGTSLFLGEAHDLAGLVCELVEHAKVPPRSFFLQNQRAHAASWQHGHVVSLYPRAG